MRNYRREEFIEQITWSTAADRVLKIDYDLDCIKTLECWDYENMSAVQDGENFRRLTLVQNPPSSSSKDVEKKLNDWLLQKNGFVPPSPPENAGELRGGLRLVLCDRPGLARGMTLSRRAFESVEKAFRLHSSTLSSFCSWGGMHATFFSRDASSGQKSHVHIIAKAYQKAEVANWLLSLTYDMKTGWTNAFICGHGIALDRKYDTDYGSQEEQLIGSILSNPIFWSNILVVPSALLQLCTDRTHTRLFKTDEKVILTENSLGVTFAGMAGQRRKRDDWPEDIDVKKATRDVHSLLTQIVFMNSCCYWMGNYAKFLLSLDATLSWHSTEPRQRLAFEELQDTIKFLNSSIDHISSAFSGMRDRTTIQLNLLFSIVGQQDSIINRKGNSLNTAIAQSTKEDSISMSTFTFITAVFLPGTYIASLFSMSMFNWQQGSSDKYANSSSGSVSKDFWIYWATTIPLTMITVGGWYAWYRYADWKWHRSLRNILESGRKAWVDPGKVLEMEQVEREIND